MLKWMKGVWNAFLDLFHTYKKPNPLDLGYRYYKVVHDDDPTYLVVEKDNITKELITLHPSTQELRVPYEENGVKKVSVPKDHWTEQKQAHALRCGCLRCRGLASDLKDTVKSTGAQVINGRDKAAVKKAFKSLASMPNRGEFVGE